MVGLLMRYLLNAMTILLHKRTPSIGGCSPRAVYICTNPFWCNSAQRHHAFWVTLAESLKFLGSTMQIARKTRPLKPGKDFAVARLLGRIVQGKALLNLEKGAKLFHQ